MAWVIPRWSRSFLIEGVGGKIGSEVDLTGLFNFRGGSDEHSAEFRLVYS
jgi:hypothetical protein